MQEVKKGKAGEAKQNMKTGEAKQNMKTGEAKQNMNIGTGDAMNTGEAKQNMAAQELILMHACNILKIPTLPEMAITKQN